MKRIDKISIIDEVVKQISELIRSGEYQKGDKLPTEEALKNNLGVGRSTIREALRVLQAYGMVEIKPGRGAFVLDKSDYNNKMIRDWFMEKEDELHELMEVRLAMETAAISLAVERGSPEQLERINKIHQKFKKSVEKNNNIELAALDDAFHKAIIQAANNRYLERIGGLISDSLIEYRKRSFSVAKNVIHALDPHEEILGHIKEKNKQAAIHAMEKHIAISLDDIKSVLEE